MLPQHEAIVRVSRVEAIVIDHDRLILAPHFPSIAGNFPVDPFTKRTGEGRAIESWQLSLQFRAKDHSRHGNDPLAPHLFSRQA